MGFLAHHTLASPAVSHDARSLMAFSLGLLRVVIGSNPETVQEILCGPMFSSRPIKASARKLMFEWGMGFAPMGEYWKHLRRVEATHMFSPRRISAREGVRARIADHMVMGLAGGDGRDGFHRNSRGTEGGLRQEHAWEFVWGEDRGREGEGADGNG